MPRTWPPQLATHGHASRDGRGPEPQERAMAETREPQMFQQIMQQLTQGQGSSPPDAFDFTTKPTTSELEYKLDRCFVKSWSTSGDADGETADVGALAVDPTDPNTGGRDYLAWQKQVENTTPGPDDNNVGLPAVQLPGDEPTAAEP